jgi:plastocyanin
MPVSAGKRGVVGSVVVALALAMAGLLLFGSTANAATNPSVQSGTSCPAIANKPGAIPHVDYNGIQHLTYCVPATVNPGQNVIRLHGTNLFPKQPGYITRFDPELIYTNGTVPRVDILHLHHAVWVVNGQPQFAVGEEKTIVQTPRGFGWRTEPTDHWLLNDMLHDLVGQPAHVFIVWRIDFLPDTAPAAATMHTVTTQWMSVAGPQPRVGVSSPIYPVYNALKGMGKNGKYTFPDQAPNKDRQLISPTQTWTPDHAETLIETAGHLHPGGLYTTLKDRRGSQTNTLFTSRAHYYEPAGEVSWDVAMGGTTPDWRVKVKPGDHLSVHSTYDTSQASWYEVMGIMPVAVYDGTDVGGVDAMSSNIPQTQRLTHTHLAENDHHGGGPTSMPDALNLPDGPFMSGPIDIQGYLYSQGDLHSSGAAGRPPVVHAGGSLTFKNLDDAATPSTWHTITSCKDPCNRDTGIAYPIANGPTFDSGQLGTNPPFGAPATGNITWKTPKHLKPGTYTYFCRVHPFMRGSFRVKP